MAKESLEKTIKERERFMEASKEVWPLILKIREIMDKYKLPDSVSITVGTDGYSEFSPRGMAWELHTYNHDPIPKARFDYSEQIPLEGVQV